MPGSHRLSGVALRVGEGNRSPLPQVGTQNGVDQAAQTGRSLAGQVDRFVNSGRLGNTVEIHQLVETDAEDGVYAAVKLAKRFVKELGKDMVDSSLTAQDAKHQLGKQAPVGACQ